MIVVKRNTDETMKQTTINDYVRYRNSRFWITNPDQIMVGLGSQK